MRVTVNGAAVELADGVSVAELVHSHAGDQRRVAVALGGEVVPRGQWAQTRLAEGDCVEVLAPVAGG
jgi:sulfur carrier protein